MASGDIEEEPVLAVSSLRSRFEQLAAGSSSLVQPKLVSSEPIPSPVTRPSRPRAASNQSLNVDSTVHILRGTSSSSDLKTDMPEAATSAIDFKALARRRPPPPATQTDSNAQVVKAASGLKPTEVYPSATKSAALKRPPPPPPTRLAKSGGASPTSSPLARPVPLPPSVIAPESPPKSALRPHVPPVPPRPTFLVSHSPENSVADFQAESSPTENIPPRPGRATPSPDLRTNSVDERDSSTDSSSSQPPPIPPSRSSRLSGLPPPPPRHRTSRSPNSGGSDVLSPSSSTGTGPPPPLPSRRSTATPENLSSQKSPPPRRSTMARPIVASALLPELNGNGYHINGSSINETPAPSPIDRKPYLGKPLPPPTRTIGLGDKLPTLRRPTIAPGELSSDEEDALEEESPASRVIDTLPDTSSASRRPPALTFREGSSPPRLPYHPHSGCVIASGPNFVVSHVHHVKIYNLEVQDTPIYDLEMKSLGMKDAKIVSMEFRPSLNKVDRGCIVWFGTKDGSLFEMDIRKGQIMATKPAAHLHPVSYMFRRGRSMVTLDESGKALIFSPDPDRLDQDVSLIYTAPKAVRTTDKNDFVKFLDGKLWTASRNESHGGGTASGKMPIIRVYDIFSPGSPGKSIMPGEQCGQVLTATIHPTEPDKVWVGHEEGYVSTWALDTDDGWPRCIEVSKVSTSDILCLEGVNDKLWAGSRNGMIAVYDVSQKPWVMTNCWKAHLNLPVLRIFVNYRAIEANKKLCVVSLGRDDAVKLWDGLLGVDWVEKELVKNEATFSDFQDITALVVSWNCDSARPDHLNDDPRNANFFTEVFDSTTPPDVISFSFQEVIDLESRKMAAKNMLLGGKKKDDALSDRVTGAYKRWHDKLSSVVKAKFGPLGVEYTAVNTESLVGLFSCIFLRNTQEFVCRDKSITAIKRGMGGRYGNKGAVIARLVIADSSICFINCHLAAGQHALKQRNADLAAILEEKGIFEASPSSSAYVRGGDGTMVLDHEFVLLNGDLNYRIDVNRRETYTSAFRSGDLSGLLAHDQLIQQLEHNKTFRLRGFSEGLITFRPTYKYDPRSDEYDTSEKRRTPAWCDRILWRARTASRMQQLGYRRYEVNVSDHRPISATFVIKVKSVRQDEKLTSRRVVESAWADREVQFLDLAHKFYVSQALL